MNDKLSLYELTAALFSLFGLFFVEAGISCNPLEFGLGKIFTAIYFGVVGLGTFYNFSSENSRFDIIWGILLGILIALCFSFPE